jgi:S-methylmethionine-dependent homocysteine/selenocysteine methylase
MSAAVTEAVRVIGERPMRIGVYANAFPPQGDAESANENLHEIRKDLTPEGYLKFARDWAARGATVIGGCCGIGPEHIAALRAAL